MNALHKSHSGTSPGYETRDADAGTVLKYLVYLTVGVVLSCFACWGLFGYYAAKYAGPTPASPFAGTRQLPSGPQLQVNPREDLLQFREAQEKSLESYAWENRENGTVRIPIERAMDLLVQKGLPVAAPASPEDESSKSKLAQLKGNSNQ